MSLQKRCGIFHTKVGLKKVIFTQKYCLKMTFSNPPTPLLKYEKLHTFLTADEPF